MAEQQQGAEPATDQRIEVSCRSCGAQIFFEALERTAHCPYCDSPSVVDRPASPDRPDPVFALGFGITRDDAARRMLRWIRRRKMAPFGLKGKTAEHVRGVYLPTYLYSATAHTSYSASIAESYKKGKENKTEYRDLNGDHATYVADIQDAACVLGRAPYSLWKILGAIGAALLAVALIGWILSLTG